MTLSSTLTQIENNIRSWITKEAFNTNNWFEIMKPAKRDGAIMNSLEEMNVVFTIA